MLSTQTNGNQAEIRSKTSTSKNSISDITAKIKPKNYIIERKADEKSAVSRGAGLQQVGQPSYGESAPENSLIPGGHLDTNRAGGTKGNSPYPIYKLMSFLSR